MSCLKISALYAYLEGDLSSEEKARVENHLNACSKCRQALEERRLLSEAWTGLPPLELPADFTERVLARLDRSRRRRRPLRLVLLATAALSTASLALLFIISGQNVFSLLSAANKSLLEYAKDGAIICVKALALFRAAGKSLQPVRQALVKTLYELNSLLSPAAQAALIISFLGLFCLLFYFLGRTFSLEKKHEE